MSERLDQRDALATQPADGDLFHVVDISDSTDHANGTSKKIAYSVLVPDASDTVKGKVELATTAETTTGTDATRAVTPDGLHDMTSLAGAAWFLDTDAMTEDSATKVPSQQSTKAYVDTSIATQTSKTYITPVIKSWTGWQLYDTVTPTYTSADDPTYTITFAAVDLTSVMSVGMKVKFTNNSTTFYGIITAIAFSTNTVVTLYGGTDYDVANSAISAFYFSTDRAPQGFPMDPTKWTVSVVDSTQRNSAISAATWTNVGTTNEQITIPIGAWDVFVKTSGRSDRTSAGTGDSLSVALSTANNTASDAELMTMVNYYGSGVASTSDLYGGTGFLRKQLVLSSKTLYYLNWYTQNAGTIIINEATFGGTTIMKAVCAYL